MVLRGRESKREVKSTRSCLYLGLRIVKKKINKVFSGSKSFLELLQVEFAALHVVGGSVVRQPDGFAHKVAFRFNEIL